MRGGLLTSNPYAMAEIVDISGVSRLLDRLGRLAPLAAVRALSRCGLIAVREAKDNAPISPDNQILSATLRRKRRTARKTTPGGLEQSISHEVRGGNAPECSVFVASNAPAGKYARRIHDEKGVTWHRRGPGTVAKGQRADDKFIERAIRDNHEAFLRCFKDEIERTLP